MCWSGVSAVVLDGSRAGSRTLRHRRAKLKLFIPRARAPARRHHEEPVETIANPWNAQSRFSGGHNPPLGAAFISHVHPRSRHADYITQPFTSSLIVESIGSDGGLAWPCECADQFLRNPNGHRSGAHTANWCDLWQAHLWPEAAHRA